MKTLKTLMIVFLFGSMILVTMGMAGCEDKLISGDDNLEPEPQVLTPREKAIEIAKRIHERRAAVVRNAIETADFSTFAADLDKIYDEEIGELIGYEPVSEVGRLFRAERSYMHTLFETHYEINPNGETRMDETAASDIDLIVTYLQFKLESPEETRDSLFNYFGNAVIEGETTTNPQTIAERYDFYSLVQVPADLAEKAAGEIVGSVFTEAVQVFRDALEEDVTFDLALYAAFEVILEVHELASGQEFPFTQEDWLRGWGGFDTALVVAQSIYRKTTDEDVIDSFENEPFLLDVSIADEFLRLMFRYPEEKGYIFSLFTQSVKKGRVTTDVKKLAEQYDFFMTFEEVVPPELHPPD